MVIMSVVNLYGDYVVLGFGVVQWFDSIIMFLVMVVGMVVNSMVG